MRACLVALLAGACGGGGGSGGDVPGDPSTDVVDYLVAFVATLGHPADADQTPPHFGVDVISASNPAPQGPDGGLWVRLPGGRLRKLFPLPVHERRPGLIDTPEGELWRGAVVEPNVSEDGRTLYFAYFHDQTWKAQDGGWQNLKLSFKGADLYRMDLGPLLANHDLHPGRLAVQRLTFKQYTGPARSDVFQTDEDRFRDALNPALARASGMSYWGTVDMHLTEMRTRDGLKAVWVSNRARTANSNPFVGDANHNFNLYTADIRPDGSLGPARQFQYYTTTSALSPVPGPDGIAFSYQSSTDEPRRWDIQWVDSEGRWRPLIGYAHATELFHLGAYVVDADGRDWFVGTKYYQFNDGGFGQLHKVPFDAAGLNRFVPGTWGLEPEQLSELLTLGASGKDEPSERVVVDGELRYVGKFTTPRAGRRGGEYVAAWTPTSANRWLTDADGQVGVFRSELVYRPNLEPFEPYEPVDRVAGRGLLSLVRDETGTYDLLWPTPILSWLERTGEPVQRVAPPIVDPATPIPAGLPFAEVGTSALWNTDIRPYDCYLAGGRPLNPNALLINEVENLLRGFEGLRRVQDPADPCRYLGPEDVLGVAVQLTSNRTDLGSMYEPEYVTDGHVPWREAVELLGVFSVRAENQSDQSFMARIPADVPFELHLLDRRTGLKLVDVRSWHSLKPRERRNDCGGCHQHEAGFAIPFEGTEASAKPAADMTALTRFLTYDAQCAPVLRTAEAPTVPTPEWRADVWPGFDRWCGDCHDAGRSANTRALEAFDYADEESAWTTMKERQYASSLLGALGSPAFWAAYGRRTDGRDNSRPEFRPDYAAGVWGYQYSPLHAVQPGLCSSGDEERAEWVYRFGRWIDNHMPRDTDGAEHGYRLDRFHPTVDMALLDDGRLRVGHWDDRGRLDVEVRWNGALLATRSGSPNGALELALPAQAAPGDTLTVTVTDAAGNRQRRTFTLGELERRRASEPSGR